MHGKNTVLAGHGAGFGPSEGVLFATGIHTEFGRIAHLTQSAGDAVSPLRTEIAHLSRVIGIVAVGIGPSTGVRGNPFFLGGAILEIGLVVLIDYTAFGNVVFGTSPIERETWLFMVPFAVAMLIFEETRKRFVRRRMLSQRFGASAN